ncbi:gliding motility protein [Lasius niger]|uniref:Gliding motility protein n=1 Tax=Lasius niger TaxID=67767 RepID=A0A0J7KTY3_LASNI|nr:gliding motility protein [Lasius niger]
MNTEAEGEDERRFKIWFRINEQEPIMIPGLTTNTYAQVKNNDKYAYNFFMKCVESGKIMNDEPIEVLFKSINDVDYTPVEYVSPDEQQLTDELETLSDVTQDETMLKVTYNYQGELYEVTESSGTHSKLEADNNFFAEFFQKAIENNIVQDNLGESYCSQINPHHTMSAQEVLNETPDNDENGTL